MMKSVEEKSRIQEAAERTAREDGAESGLAEWISKTVSERPLIGYGSSRYEQKRWQDSLWLPANRVEPRNNTSLAMSKLQGTFLCELRAGRGIFMAVRRRACTNARAAINIPACGDSRITERLAARCPGELPWRASWLHERLGNWLYKNELNNSRKDE